MFWSWSSCWCWGATYIYISMCIDCMSIPFPIPIPKPVLFVCLLLPTKKKTKQKQKQTKRSRKPSMAMDLLPAQRRRRSIWLMLLLAMAATFLSISISSASDPSPLQDYCVADLSPSQQQQILLNGFPCRPPSNLSGSDFTSTLFRTPPNASSNPLGYAAIRATASSFPALNTAGLSASRASFVVGGVNSPHVHPRASELVYLQEGKLWVGFVDGEGRLISSTLEAGDLFLFPQGLIHFQMNVGSTPATAIVAFSSQNPGTSRIPGALFAAKPDIPDETLLRSFSLSPKELRRLRRLLATASPH